MKIVIAPDSFKESMSAIQVADAIERGILHVEPSCQTVKVPLADGGEGTMEAITTAQHGTIVDCTVAGPLRKPVKACYGIIQTHTAIIEIASACGLDLLALQERDPMKTTTYGVGELIVHALDQGVRHFIIGLGGSATNDGGIGMLQALGAEIADSNGEQVADGGTGLTQVNAISTVHMDPRLKDCTFEVASDVNNPLTGPTGATHVYGPQKGADTKMVPLLDQAMCRYASILQETIGDDFVQIKGAGAAGGLGVACLAFLQASLKPGIEIVMEFTGLAEHIKDADLVFTGEGKIDEQTIFGKTPAGVAKVAKAYDVPVIAIAGANQVSTNALYHAGITAIFSMMDQPMSLEYALKHGEYLTEKLAGNIMRMMQCGHYIT